MRRLLAALTVVAAAATACGGSGSLAGDALAKAVEAETGQQVDVQQNGDGLTVKTEDGSITFGSNGEGTDITGTDAERNNFSLASGTDVPADFPLPVPDNVDISSATTFEMPQGKSFGLIFDFDPSRADEIIKLYRDALDAQGLSVEDNGGGPEGLVILGDSADLTVIVYLDDFGDYWECTISWTPF